MVDDSARQALALALGDFWYWGAGPSHGDIDRVFDALDLVDRIDGGGKREKVEQAVLVASPGELQRLVSALIDLLFERGFLEPLEETANPIALLKRRLVPLGMSFDENGVTSGSIGVEPGPALDAGELRNHVVRIQRAVEHEDSAQILGSAKELLESTAKFVLQEQAIAEPSKFPGLMSEALGAIGLHAKAVDGDDDKRSQRAAFLGRSIRSQWASMNCATTMAPATVGPHRQV